MNDHDKMRLDYLFEIEREKAKKRINKLKL